LALAINDTFSSIHSMDKEVDLKKTVAFRVNYLHVDEDV